MNILITAGPTREPIDAVRYIGNRSSGKMGVAIARAAADAGHHTTLLLGRGASAPHHDLPTNVTTHPFDSSAELKQLLDAHWPDHDVLIMAAAVADYRPTCVHDGKLPRNAPNQPLTLHLQPTPDLVALAAATKRPNQKVIAFALEEPHQLEQRAARKLKNKAADAIVANSISTLDADAVTPTLITPDGKTQRPDRMPKPQFAAWLINTLDQI